MDWSPLVSSGGDLPATPSPLLPVLLPWSFSALLVSPLFIAAASPLSMIFCPLPTHPVLQWGSRQWSDCDYLVCETEDDECAILPAVGSDAVPSGLWYILSQDSFLAEAAV